MKIRIKGNSMRFRLTKTEVDTFGREGFIEEKTMFPNGTFSYVLVSRPEGSGLSAELAGTQIRILIPQFQAEEWVATSRVGYENSQDLGNGEQLYILLEKDFQCLDNTTEDQSDMYPNPLADQHK